MVILIFKMVSIVHVPVVSMSWWRFIRIVAHKNKGMYVCCSPYYKELASYYAVRWCPLRLNPVRTWIHWQPAEDKSSGCSVCSCVCAWVWVYVPESAAMTIISSCVLVALVAPQCLLQCANVWVELPELARLWHFAVVNGIAAQTWHQSTDTVLLYSSVLEAGPCSSISLCVMFLWLFLISFCGGTYYWGEPVPRGSELDR